MQHKWSQIEYVTGVNKVWKNLDIRQYYGFGQNNALSN